MKKLMIMFVAAGLLATSALTSCKKEEKVLSKNNTSNSSVSSKQRLAPQHLSNLVSVSSYGFLVIPDTNAYAEYVNFLDSNTTQDITTFHSGIGFVSQANVNGQANNYIAPSVHNSEYIFDQSGMVQIDGIIVRSVNDDGYFLAMPASSLNQTSYNELVNRQFNPSYMCKLWLGNSYNNDLKNFVLGNIGLDNTGGTQPTPPIALGKKIVISYYSEGVYIVETYYTFLGIVYKHTTDIYLP